uniref:Uncharacterized protein n=1 Tax=Leersia perrieri TaxID=77586 RepID=A0A0D9WPM5_9ORYZ
MTSPNSEERVPGGRVGGRRETWGPTAFSSFLPSSSPRHADARPVTRVFLRRAARRGAADETY